MYEYTYEITRSFEPLKANDLENLPHIFRVVVVVVVEKGKEKKKKGDSRQWDQ